MMIEGVNSALDGREAGYLAVRDVLRGESFAADTLRTLRVDGRLSGRDAAMAMEVALGTVRHINTIERVLRTVARYDPRRTRRELRAILSAAAYQVIWMSRTPVFAAVDQAVKLARRHAGGRSPGMVNAILRNLTRAIDERRGPWQRLNARQVRVEWDQACIFKQDVLPPAVDAERHLAAAAGEREERYSSLVARFGPEGAEQIAWAAQAVPPTVLQRNALRIDAQAFQALWMADATPDVAFMPAGVPVVGTAPFADGMSFVQDPTARAAATLVEVQPGQRVLDLCAAPGGKSVALAIDMQDQGEVVACDSSPDRLARVQENVERLGLTCVRTCPPPTDSSSDLGHFDAALADVPCSNTGVIARRPEARLGLTPEKLQSLLPVQQELLRTAARHVKPGGRLVYSTCSLEAEENERQVEAFLAEHADWSFDCQQTTLPAWGARLTDWRDGGYAARLIRSQRIPSNS